jgi:hypothetical protein
MPDRNLFRLITLFNAFLVLTLTTSFAADSQPSKLLHVFADFPKCGLDQQPCFPTPNDRLEADNLEEFAARIRTNDQYGMPGWTRDLGERFHKGVDIRPIHFEKSGQTVKIDYYDPKTKKNFVEYEKIIIPKDEIFSVLDGTVLVANQEDQRSGYGRYVMIQHKFSDGSPFLTMYAHMSQVDVTPGVRLSRGDHIGWMGNTSSSSGGRMYLKFVPHCHFEVGRIINNNFVNTKYAKLLYPRILGGNADPRNIQPFDPIQFLKTFKAESRAQLVKSTPTNENNDVYQTSRTQN